MVMFLVIFCMSFHVFPENLPILSAFIMPPDSRGGLGAPLSGPGGHQNVDISSGLKAYWHIGMFMFFPVRALAQGSLCLVQAEGLPTGVPSSWGGKLMAAQK